MGLDVVQARHLRPRPPLSKAACHVTGGRADIQEREWFMARDNIVDQLPQRAVSAPMFVDPREVGQAAARFLRRKRVEDLRLQNSPIESMHFQLR